MQKKAFIFDLNGTMINDMDYHIAGWHQILNRLDPGITIDRVKSECYGKNSELLNRIFPGRFTNEEMEEMIVQKEGAYQEAFRPHLKLVEGLYDFIIAAHEKGVSLSIGSAAIMHNIDYVLEGTGIRQFIDVIVSAEHVKISKPDPETFLRAAEMLNVRPANCLVFEDTPKGVEAAKNAGMKAVVLTLLHQPEDFRDQDNIIRFADNFTGLIDLIDY